MRPLVSDRMAFLKQLEDAKKPNKKPKLNKNNKKYIDNWIQCNYSELVEAICWNFNIVRNGGQCAFDYLNNCIINIYNDTSLSFKNQSECNVYMEKELHFQRFIIKVNIA